MSRNRNGQPIPLLVLILLAFAPSAPVQGPRVAERKAEFDVAVEKDVMIPMPRRRPPRGRPLPAREGRATPRGQVPDAPRPNPLQQGPRELR